MPSWMAMGSEYKITCTVWYVTEGGSDDMTVNWMNNEDTSMGSTSTLPEKDTSTGFSEQSYITTVNDDMDDQDIVCMLEMGQYTPMKKSASLAFYGLYIIYF